MVRTSMDVASFTCDSFRLIDAWLFSSFNEYYILKKLAKLEKVLTFLSLVFFKLEEIIHHVVIISKL